MKVGQLAHTLAEPRVRPARQGLGQGRVGRAVAGKRLPARHVGADLFRQTVSVILGLHSRSHARSARRLHR